MSTAKKIGLIFLFSILFMITGLAFNEHEAEATTTPKFRFQVGTAPIADDATCIVKSKQVNMYIAAVSGSLPANATVTWESSEQGVVALSASSSAITETITMYRQGPGASLITARIAYNNGTSNVVDTLQFTAEVELLVDTFKTGTEEANYSGSLVLQLAKGETKQIKLKYVNYADGTTGDAIDPSAVTFISDKSSVAVLDADPNTLGQGYVTAVGGGEATITIRTLTANAQNKNRETTLKIVVIPTFTLNAEDASGAAIVKDSGTRTSPAYYTGIPSNFTIKSNGTPASNLTWKVYDCSSGTNPVEIQSGKGKATFSVSELTNEVEFTNVKAGTYEIIAFPGPNMTKNTPLIYGYMKIEVPIDISSKTITMVVGDTFDIVAGTNVPSVNTFSSYISSDTNIVFPKEDGTISAKKRGTATVTCTYNPSLNLFDKNPPDMVLTIHVVDSISLSENSALIYTNGTLLLTANATDSSAPIKWTSSVPGVATATSQGSSSCLIKGLKAGTTTITASQMIKGVVKKATCLITVQQSVDTIELDPLAVTVGLGQYKTIAAHFTPSTLSGVKLEWKSSDTSIVTIDSSTATTATILASTKKGGHAVISAINQDNVVVGYCHVTVQQPVSSITLSETSLTASVNTGRVQLRATVGPEDAVNKEVQWTSSDTTKATVDANGLVSIKKTGTVSIIAVSVDNPAVKAICNITILVPVSSVSLDESSKTMYVGQTARLGYTILPTNSSNAGVTWTSTNTSVANVDATGLVTAKGVGSAVIILRTVDQGLAVYCNITVKRVATGVKLDVSTLELAAGKSYTFKATLTPADSTETAVTWESSDTKIAVVDANGKITGKSAGNVVIMAKISSGSTAYCKVTVIQPASGLILNYSEKTVYIGEKFEMTASVSPSTATQLGVKWESSNEEVATITAKGEVSALAGGVTIITATTLDGGYVANCVLTVRESVSSISINYQTYYLGVDKFVNLEATVSTPNATNQKVAWTSSNEDVATVTQRGKVTGHKLGYATITATALDGSEVEATCDIRVVEPATSVSVNYTTLALLVGQTKKVKVTIKPDKATFKTAKWSSSDTEVAVVDDDGLIIAKKTGNATITAEARDNSGKKALTYITVYDRVAATAITLQDKKVVMLPGEEKIVQIVLMPATSNDGCTWSTDNAAVAKVDKKTGKITARATGVAYITVMTDSGKTAQVEVVVIGLNYTELTLEQYTTYEYPLAVEGATSPVSWNIDNPNVAVINNGVISSRGIGTATITAKVNGRKLTCKLKVVKIGGRN